MKQGSSRLFGHTRVPFVNELIPCDTFILQLIVFLYKKSSFTLWEEKLFEF